MFGADVGSAVAWLSDAQVPEVSGFEPAIYAGLLAFFTSGLIVFNIGLVRSWLPGERLHRLQPEIEDLVRKYEEANREQTDTIMLKVAQLTRELDRLRIPYPNPSIDESRPWWFWMRRLYAFAATKDVKAARRDRGVWEKYFSRDDL